MIVRPERIAAILLTVVAVAWPSSAWGQPAKPESTPEPVLTAAEQKLLGEFHQLYVLADGEAVKHFFPPFHPGRNVYYRQTQPASLIRSETEEPDSFFFRWRNSGLDCVSGAVFGVGSLSDLIPILLDFDPHEIEGDEELLKVPIRGDWILREGVSEEKLLAAMEKTLREQLQIPVKISVKELDRKVVVAKGDFRFTPTGDSERIQIYSETLVEKGRGGGSGDFNKFVRGVSRFVDRRVVSDVEHPPEGRLSWRYNAPMRPDEMAQEDVEQVLKHVTEQTGLTFSSGVRPVRVLMIERDE